MCKLNLFIDGSWLFKACGAGKALANTTEFPESRFRLSFEKLVHSLSQYVSARDSSFTAVGDLFISTSIFTLPPDFEDWPNQFDDILDADILTVMKGVQAREAFIANAQKGGFRIDAVFRPRIRDYIVRKLRDKRYHEKQVDSAVVALLVRSAIVRGDDHHAVITGDADILPAIRIAYPEYTRNVVIVTTHPEELKAEHRQSSFSLIDFTFDIPPFYLQEHAHEIIDGDNVYRCAECNKVFARAKPVPAKARPYCKPCHETRD